MLHESGGSTTRPDPAGSKGVACEANSYQPFPEEPPQGSSATREDTLFLSSPSQDPLNPQGCARVGHLGNLHEALQAQLKEKYGAPTVLVVIQGGVGTLETVLRLLRQVGSYVLLF